MMANRCHIVGQFKWCLEYIVGYISNNIRCVYIYISIYMDMSKSRSFTPTGNFNREHHHTLMIQIALRQVQHASIPRIASHWRQLLTKLDGVSWADLKPSWLMNYRIILTMLSSSSGKSSLGNPVQPAKEGTTLRLTLLTCRVSRCSKIWWSLHGKIGPRYTKHDSPHRRGQPLLVRGFCFASLATPVLWFMDWISVSRCLDNKDPREVLGEKSCVCLLVAPAKATISSESSVPTNVSQISGEPQSISYCQGLRISGQLKTAKQTSLLVQIQVVSSKSQLLLLQNLENPQVLSVKIQLSSTSKPKNNKK